MFFKLVDMLDEYFEKPPDMDAPRYPISVLRVFTWIINVLGIYFCYIATLKIPEGDPYYPTFTVFCGLWMFGAFFWDSGFSKNVFKQCIILTATRLCVFPMNTLVYGRVDTSLHWGFQYKNFTPWVANYLETLN